MPKKIQVNITTAVNVAAVRKEKRNGRDVIVVPSATLPDNVVMNRIKYPADEIAKSFMTLNRKPAPLGHPMVNGKFVSASDPEGINISHIGAWNENVRQKDGRVWLDKIIDVEVANRSESGKAVLKAINDGGPVHTSTGLFCELGDPDGDDHDGVARNIEFDHDAILLNEEGAATPEQGVGMLVNAAGETEEIEVRNSFYDSADESLDWAVESVVRAVERQQKASVMERIKSAITDAVAGITRESQAMNEKETEMADDKKLEELSATVNTLAESLKTLADGIPAAIETAIKPLVEAQSEAIANAKAAEEAEKKALVDKIVKAGLLNEAEAGELTLNAAKALAAKTAAKPAAGVVSAFNGASAGEDWYNPNELDGKAV